MQVTVLYGKSQQFEAITVSLLSAVIH